MVHLSAHQLFERQVDRSPEAVALVFEDRQLTYRELDQRANQVAHFLRKSGVAEETLVGVCLDRRPELVVALLGVWKAGAAYVPIDPAYPRERVSFMVGDAAVRVLLTERKHLELLPAAGVTTACLDDDWPTIARESTARPAVPLGPSALAYVMYTSGSTGRPKGAMILHSGLVNYLTWAIEAYGVVPGGSVPVHSSIAFDLTVTSLYPALLAGGQVELLAEDVGALNLLAALRRRKDRNLVKITPAHLDVLTQQLRPDELAGLARAFVIGGENLPAESLAPWRDFAPRTRLVNEYGPTETVVGCCIHEVREGDPRNGPVPIGRAIASTELYVLDEARKPVAPGEMGELYIGGAGVARGYLNRPELTQERFLPDPFSGREGARLYKTGDLARQRADGTLEFLGRADDQVKIRGYRIELGEIEAVLASHAAVQSCAVLSREDTPGNKQLVGYVVGRTDERPAAADLRGFLEQRLPEYMAPAHFVFLDALPLTHNGKVDRKALPAPRDAGGPATDAPVLQGETEKAIAAIWSELLHVENIGRDADFFELGGHSLLAIRALARIRDTLGVELSPEMLFEEPTLKGLAARVAQAKGPPEDVYRIPPLDAAGPCVASSAQQQLWLLDRLVPDSPAYNIVDVVSIAGLYDARALKSALKELVSRHETLRTSFSQTDGQLMQVVSPPFEPELAELDLSALPEAERRDAWARVAGEQGRRLFDLSRLPLVRATIVHASPTEHRLLVTIHHIIADEWSMELLHRELTQLYAAFVAGRPSPLEPLAVQYAAYAAWQRRWLQGELVQAQVDYWKNELKGALPVLALPVDRPRPPTPTLRGATEPFRLPKELLERLRSLGLREQTTLFMVLEAAFAALLRRHTGQDDILVGTPISGRIHTETQRLIGNFLNTVVLRAQFQEDPSFRALLHQTRTRALGAYAHADLPFEQLVAELSPDREPGRSPLFQVMFVHHGSERATEISNLAGRRELETGTSKFDLTLFTSETADGLEGLIEYGTDVFEAETIRRLCRSYAQLLDAMVRAPDERISRLPLPDEELARLRQLNQTARDYPRASNVARLFEQQVARSPDAPAVRRGPTSIPYRALDARANRLARALRRRGVRRGSIVGLSLTRSIDMVAAMLAVLKAGGAYLPLDPAFPAARLGFMVEDSGLALVVSESEHASRHGAPADRTFDLDLAGAELDGESAEPLAHDEHSARPEDPAYVLYTSGSTGKPKGVVVHEQAAVNVLTAIRDDLRCGPQDRWLAVTTLSFDIALLELIVPLLVGGQVVLASRDEAADGEALQRLIEEHAITIMQATPVTWRTLVDTGWKGRAGMKVVSGGEPLAVDLADALVQRVAEVWNDYGPTETTVYSTGGRITDPRGDGVTIGKPVANTSIWILDAHLQPVAVGVPGEIYIGGDGVGLGYLNRPELTRERFTADPFGWAEGSRLYRTGDLGRFRRDGRIEHLGRTDFQVKVRGFRIELGEIETRIAEHPAVREVCVAVARPATGEPSIVAYFASRPGQAVPVVDLRSRLRVALPDYMVPQYFVELDALPRTQNGKVDRKALPDPFAGVSHAATEYVAPRNPVEEALARIWQEVLEVERVGIHDDFFDLGGHSLLATRVASRIRKELGLELELRAFFDAPTVAQLAARSSGAARATAPAIVPRPHGEGPLEPSFAQERLWYLDQLEPGSSAYNLTTALRLRGPLSAAALEKAVREVTLRHEALRTTFSTDGDGKAVQVVHPEPLAALERIDLRTDGDPVAAARATAAREARKPFDLARGPLVRAQLLQLGDADHVLLVTMHHIVTDGWSGAILVREVTVLYDAFARGLPSPLPPLAIQYADFAAWQREWLSGKELQRQIDFWKRHLDGAPTALELPTDRPRPPEQTYEGTSLSRPLGKELSGRVDALARTLGATPFMVLMSAFNVVLSRYGNQRDVVVGTPIANRNRSEIEPLIGFFVNTLALRTRVEPEMTFEQLVARFKETTVAAYAHQDLPFEKLVTALDVPRDMSRSPVFQVMFILQNAPDAPMELPGIRTGTLDFEYTAAKFDLLLGMAPTPDGYVSRWEINTDLFDRATIERIARHLEHILSVVATAPGSTVATLERVPDEELAHLRQLNRTVTDYPRDRTVAQLVEQQASEHPESPAVRRGTESITYGALDARANRLARLLRRRGVKRGSLVGLSLSRSIDMVGSMLAVLKAGGAYVPLDPAFPPARLAFMVEDSGLALVVSEAEHASRHGAPADKTLELDRIGASLDAESAAPLPQDDGAARPEDPAYVLYTSGSTGKPKGVLVHQRAAVNVLSSMAREPGCGPGDRWLAVTTLSFDIALLELLLPLVVGGEVVLASRDEAMDGEALQRLIAEHRITILQATPATWRLLVDSGWKGSPALEALCGGEALPLDLAEALVGRVGQLWNVYGPTETTVWSTCCRVTEPRAGITVGRPIANTSVWIVDPGLQPCPIGVPGEITIGGDGVALGYLNRPELTRERFVPDPFGWAPGSRLYRTGDLGRIHQDGRIECLGRTDFQVKVNGFRIELGEIEARLAEHPAIRESCVIVHESAPGDVGIVAYFALRPGQSVTSTDLRAHVRGALPDYMVPRTFVELPGLPRTNNNKVDRKALPAPFAASQASDVAVAPRTDQERLVAAVWQELLGRSVGAHENFFEAGGHSLLVVRAIGAIQKRTGVRLSPRVFVLDTLAQIAAQLDQARPPEAARKDAAPRAPSVAPPPEPTGLLARLKNRIFR